MSKIYKRNNLIKDVVPKKNTEFKRKRSIIINNRVTPEDRDIIYKRIELSGRTIQDYVTECCKYGKVTAIETNIGAHAKVIINGDVNKIDCYGSVEVHGNSGSIDCGGSCTIDGDVNGYVDAGGSIICGNVSGNIDAGGSVRCSK